MPDSRRHRGPHPADRQLFSAEHIPVLRAAVGDYSWLLTRDYAPVAALKLVGDRYQLAQRQRLAVMRSSCSDQMLARRASTHVSAEQVTGEELQIDGFNLLTTLEAALAGGFILRGRDGCSRDLASMHGSYRKVEETLPALEIAGQVLTELNPASCLWLLDSPVSNSGRLASIIRALAEERGWNWSVELVTNPDAPLASTAAIVISADSGILDRCAHWFNLASEIIARRIVDAEIVVMGEEAGRRPGDCDTIGVSGQ